MCEAYDDITLKMNTVYIVIQDGRRSIHFGGWQPRYCLVRHSLGLALGVKIRRTRRNNRQWALGGHHYIAGVAYLYVEVEDVQYHE